MSTSPTGETAPDDRPIRTILTMNVIEGSEEAFEAAWARAAVVIAAVVTAVFTALSETLLATLIARLLATMRERVVAAVLCLPVTRIERAGHGDALSRVGADIAVLVAGSRTAIPAIFSSSVLIVAKRSIGRP